MRLPPGAKAQVGVSSWVGVKLYHGFRSGYFDAKTYVPDYTGEEDTGEKVSGFWATPSFALAKTFGDKGGVVECYFDVKRALTFNIDALAWLSNSDIKYLLDVAGLDFSYMKDSKLLWERLFYKEFALGQYGNGSPIPPRATSQFYPVLSHAWDLIKRSGYDGVCLPEKGIPTVAAMDFSQVTYGKRVKTGGGSDSWDAYDVSPLGGPAPAAPKAEGPVEVSPSQVKKEAVAPKPRFSPLVKEAPKPKSPPPSKAVKKAAPLDGPDPRFKEGELFASWRQHGIVVSPLFSRKKNVIVSMANVGFTRVDVIENLRKLVLDRVHRYVGEDASWDFSEGPVDTGKVGSTGKFLNWRSYFVLKGHQRVVLFQEDINGYLSVIVDDLVVIRSLKKGRLGWVDYERIIKELLR
jgi:hypothetical protein